MSRLALEMAIGTDPRFSAENSSIRGWRWRRNFPRGDINGKNLSPDG
jgi:hypothetical protein